LLKIFDGSKTDSDEAWIFDYIRRKSVRGGAPGINNYCNRLFYPEEIAKQEMMPPGNMIQEHGLIHQFISSDLSKKQEVITGFPAWKISPAIPLRLFSSGIT
jgi:hypothetical protein